MGLYWCSIAPLRHQDTGISVPDVAFSLWYPVPHRFAPWTLERTNTMSRQNYKTAGFSFIVVPLKFATVRCLLLTQAGSRATQALRPLAVTHTQCLPASCRGPWVRQTLKPPWDKRSSAAPLPGSSSQEHSLWLNEEWGMQTTQVGARAV